ncbi:hypothetical protein [Azospirillum sp. SYSU D00513]|uniref:hypothetical protein n=1 Tax=Azospirillum sp. SYSU D00513 TaxID=2812561 RepID=UPI001A95EA73|nr:hypothetical protein [Azospirillum sp. SYSU D00513]
MGSNPQFAPRSPDDDVLPRPGVRGVAGDAIQAARNNHLDVSGQWYGEAYASGAQPDVQPVVETIQKAMRAFPI